MNKVFNYLKSRTIWTIIVLFVINGVQGVKGYIPPFWLPLVNGILSILAIYFRIDQRQDFKE